MCDRIKMLRKHLGLTQEKFACRLHIKRGAVANYEVGRNIPADSVVSLICREFNVREEWLRTGEGEIFAETDGAVIEKLKNEFHLGTVDVEILKLFLAMGDSDRSVLSDFAMRLAYSVLKNPALSSEYERVNGELPSATVSGESGSKEDRPPVPPPDTESRVAAIEKRVDELEKEEESAPLFPVPAQNLSRFR